MAPYMYGQYTALYTNLYNLLSADMCYTRGFFGIIRVAAVQLISIQIVFYFSSKLSYATQKIGSKLSKNTTYISKYLNTSA